MTRLRHSRTPVIRHFDIKSGRVLAGKYEVIQRLGRGWEGEVFLVREDPTDIERAVKLFYPHRNPRDRVANFYARKLHRLRHCPIAIQYHTRDTIIYRKVPITLLAPRTGIKISGIWVLIRLKYFMRKKLGMIVTSIGIISELSRRINKN